MVPSAHDDGNTRSAMAKLLLCCCGAIGERRKSKWSRRVGRQARGVLMSRPAAPGCARRVACASRRLTTGGNTRHLISEPVSLNHFLKNRDSVLMTSLTARIRRVNTANPSIYCKNSIHEKCRPTIHLQLPFKDQHLNHHGSEVT